jgi:hypothetical protein
VSWGRGGGKRRRLSMIKAEKGRSSNYCLLLDDLVFEEGGEE